MHRQQSASRRLADAGRLILLLMCALVSLSLPNMPSQRNRNVFSTTHIDTPKEERVTGSEASTGVGYIKPVAGRQEHHSVVIRSLHPSFQ